MENVNLEIPLYKVFTRDIQVYGVPEYLFYANLGIGAFTILLFKIWQLLPLFIIFHKVIKKIVEKDEKMLLILSRASLKKYLGY